MKWFIASDLHGSAPCCEQMLEAYRREQADRLLLLGDVLNHGPRNDLPDGYAPKAVIAMLNEIAADVLCVRGNCDGEVDQMVLDFPVLSDYAVLTVGERLIFATHGHNYNKEHMPKLHADDVLLHGHTHVPACEPLDGGILYCNPGSVTMPKNGTARAYMTLENGILRWKTLEDGAQQHAYALQ